jgi:Transposase DDE domain group 1
MVHDVGPVVLGFGGRKPVELEAVDEQTSSDGGLVLFREFDARLGLTESFAAMIRDGRIDPVHTVHSMICQRVLGIIGGYEDQNDHDLLRSDPVFRLIAGPDGGAQDLASQPTLSRFENAVSADDLLRLQEWFVQQLVDSFDEPPGRITLDIDTFADATFGEQQLTFFHGFYNQYQYQVRVISCAENEQLTLPVLLYGTAPASLGADDDLGRVIEALRERYPDVAIHVRADSGFAVPEVYERLDSYPGVTYSIGFQMNKVMQEKSRELMAQTVAEHEVSGLPQRSFMHLQHESRNWHRALDVVIKCEVTAAGTNRRAVITNRPGASQYPDGAYQEYADRGESENRNKELSVDLCCNRLSDHRCLANLFRVMLHMLACNMLSRMRRVVQLPQPAPPTNPDGLPLEAHSESLKRKYRNRRRRQDPLGRGQAMTWRMLVIKVACRVVRRARRVRLLLSSHWPGLDFLFRIGRALSAWSPG